MKSHILFFSVLLLAFASCTDDSKKKDDPKKPEIVKQGGKTKTTPTDTSLSAVKGNLTNFEKGKIEEVKSLDNGISIKWIVKGKGQAVKKGDMVLIDYRLALPDGKIVDGNNRLNLPAVPFIIGYNMQTPGWDLAFTQLHIGDFVKIEIPAELAYGKKKIEGVIPENSANWVYVKLLAVVTPGINEDGIKSWKVAEGKPLVKEGEKEITFHSIVSTESRAGVMNTYLSNFPIKYIPGQKSIVPGLRRLMKDAHKGDRYLVVLNANQAYGKRGYANLIQPNESVLFNIEIVNERALD